MICFALVPLVLSVLAGPVLAAGQGVRPWLRSLAVWWGALILFAALDWQATRQLLGSWPDSAPAWIMLCTLAALSVGVSGLVVWVRSVESRSPDRSRCRLCGYDLRSSPQRCPECGTPVDPRAA